MLGNVYKLKLYRAYLYDISMLQNVHTINTKKYQDKHNKNILNVY